MRAWPKILLCTNYDGAWEYFEKYQDTILCVTSDIDFKRKRQHDDKADIKFAREVKNGMMIFSFYCRTMWNITTKRWLPKRTLF